MDEKIILQVFKEASQRTKTTPCGTFKKWHGVFLFSNVTWKALRLKLWTWSSINAQRPQTTCINDWPIMPHGCPMMILEMKVLFLFICLYNGFPSCDPVGIRILTADSTVQLWSVMSSPKQLDAKLEVAPNSITAISLGVWKNEGLMTWSCWTAWLRCYECKKHNM